MRSEFLKFRVLTPEGPILEVDQLTSVNIPLADDCPIGIRPGHAPLIAETIKGIVHYRGPEKKGEIKLHAGILNIRDNEIIVLSPGEVSTISPEIIQPSATEYDRLMNTLVENFTLKQD
jgi:F0F1-type ATP synthase epsilon subunit